MNINVMQKDCQYYVNEEKRVIVCVINSASNIAHDLLKEMSPDLYYSYDDCHIDLDLDMPNSFSGVARCREGDKFDVDIGKLIAFNKAKNKLCRSLFKRANTFVNRIDNELDRTITRINRLGEQLSRGYEQRNKRIAEALNDNCKGTN